ncbi:uncharacterized protein B0T23DRAFT_417062 [Neurospora hispaniola]|uniref:Uncharacterized protein n=1 Tax=Neurospora hispaniola TaxID=588809 RepID=A0AAJ0IFW4_9PEZI|nr:hypothetical protein B0T23DRAFT_417062 [Neurospora hispaniola]
MLVDNMPNRYPNREQSWSTCGGGNALFRLQPNLGTGYAGSAAAVSGKNVCGFRFELCGGSPAKACLPEVSHGDNVVAFSKLGLCKERVNWGGLCLRKRVVFGTKTCDTVGSGKQSMCSILEKLCCHDTKPLGDVVDHDCVDGELSKTDIAMGIGERESNVFIATTFHLLCLMDTRLVDSLIFDKTLSRPRLLIDGNVLRIMWFGMSGNSPGHDSLAGAENYCSFVEGTGSKTGSFKVMRSSPLGNDRLSSFLGLLASTC